MSPQPPSGAPVGKVVEGPFAGSEGIVSGIDQVLLSFVGRTIIIEVDARQDRRLVA